MSKISSDAPKQSSNSKVISYLFFLEPPEGFHGYLFFYEDLIFLHFLEITIHCSILAPTKVMGTKTHFWPFHSDLKFLKRFWNSLEALEKPNWVFSKSSDRVDSLDDIFLKIRNRPKIQFWTCTPGILRCWPSQTR